MSSRSSGPLVPDEEAVLAQDGQEIVAVPEALPPEAAPTAVYRASIFPGADGSLHEKIGEAVKALGASLGLPIWLLLQDAVDEHDHLSILHEGTMAAFHAVRGELERGEKIALVIDSRGGTARGAYQLARFLQRRCGGFVAVVPRQAKSAATLLVLGADAIIMGENAELGPLDAQISDPERESYQSALDETQSLDRLQEWGLAAFDQLMFLLIGRTGKKIETTIPHAARWITDMLRPLLEKIDVVHYTQMSRIVLEAEQYAIRLLEERYTPEQAKSIASYLVEKYPEHGFVIGPEETASIGLRPTKPTGDQNELLESLWDDVSNVTALGKLGEDTGP